MKKNDKTKAMAISGLKIVYEWVSGMKKDASLGPEDFDEMEGYLKAAIELMEQMEIVVRCKDYKNYVRITQTCYHIGCIGKDTAYCSDGEKAEMTI